MLELKNISKKFKDRQILSDFNLTVEENKKFVRIRISRFSAISTFDSARKFSFITDKNYEYA